METSKINYDTIRIKLIFLYKIIQQIELAKNNTASFKIDGYTPHDFELEYCKNLVASLGLNLIYINRIDNQIVLTRDESVNAHGVSQFLAEEFIWLGKKITEEVVTALPHMRVARMEMVIQSGMDQIMDRLKKLLEPTEK